MHRFFVSDVKSLVSDQNENHQLVSLTQTHHPRKVLNRTDFSSLLLPTLTHFLEVRSISTAPLYNPFPLPADEEPSYKRLPLSLLLGLVL